MVPKAVQTYLLHSLEAVPIAVCRTLSGQVDWDARPDPDRFTLREMAAHLADWEPIWLERVTRIRVEDNPFLSSVDEGVLCAQRDYASLDPNESLSRYRQGRDALVGAVRAMPEEVWTRKAHREFVGDVDFLQQIAMIVGHDGYHLKQAMEFTG